MGARAFGVLYLAAIAVAMIGWLWILAEGFAWAITWPDGSTGVLPPDTRQAPAQATISLARERTVVSQRTIFAIEAVHIDDLWALHELAEVSLIETLH